VVLLIQGDNMAMVSEQWREYQTKIMCERVDKLLVHAFIRWQQGDRAYFYALHRDAAYLCVLPKNIFLNVLHAKLCEVSNGQATSLGDGQGSQAAKPAT
jgi:hypothetical protein